MQQRPHAISPPPPHPPLPIGVAEAIRLLDEPWTTSAPLKEAGGNRMGPCTVGSGSHSNCVGRDLGDVGEERRHEIRLERAQGFLCKQVFLFSIRLRIERAWRQPRGKLMFF